MPIIMPRPVERQPLDWLVFWIFEREVNPAEAGSRAAVALDRRPDSPALQVLQRAADGRQGESMVARQLVSAELRAQQHARGCSCTVHQPPQLAASHRFPQPIQRRAHQAACCGASATAAATSSTPPT